MHTKSSDFEYTPLSANKVKDIIKVSRAFLDIQHPAQTGLTIRTFEILGAQRKLITTNPEIVKYDFYRSSNILVVDRMNPIVDLDFFYKDYMPLPDEVIEKYSLDCWLEQIFSDCDNRNFYLK